MDKPSIAALLIGETMIVLIIDALLSPQKKEES